MAGGRNTAKRKTLQKPFTEPYGKGETRPQDGKHPVLKPKDLIGMPWRVAFALQEDGWLLRSEIAWIKPATMPESVKDRPTTAHEKVFLFAKQPRYFTTGKRLRPSASIISTASAGSTARPAAPLMGRRAARAITQRRTPPTCGTSGRYRRTATREAYRRVSA